MELIAHRGNINGKSEKENHPSYVLEAISKGYSVEVDVWVVAQKYYLGHDSPQYETSAPFLRNEKLWCHAKNFKALEKMLEDDEIHCFWHEKDSYTLTSKGIPWVYPKRELLKGSVCVSPEIGYNGDISICKAICSDRIALYKEQGNV